MSLETLLEAAEFLEWNKPGKKSSRATRTSKKAEKFKPNNVITERKRKTPAAKLPAPKVVVPKVAVSVAASSKTPSKGATTAATVTTSSVFLPPSAIMAIEEDVEDGSDDDEDKMAMRDLRRSIGHRETHNKLEKNRRAHLKECFEALRNELPLTDERRCSNLSTLRSALRLIEQLANRQRELESEKRRLYKLKNSKQSQIHQLRKELKEKGIDYNLDDWIEVHKTSTNSTSTASECGDVLLPTVAEEEVTTTDNKLAAPVTSAEIQVLFKPNSSAKPVVLSTTAATTVPTGEVSKVLTSVANSTVQISASSAAASTESQGQQSHLQPQVVTVAKVARAASLPTGKIVLTPKVLPSPQPQLCTPVDSSRVFISSVPSQSANIIVPTSQQASVEGVPITVNPPPRIVRPLHQQLPANLSIAPKQLVLITAGNESGQQLASTLTPSTFTVPLVQQAAAPTTIPLNSLTNVHGVQTTVQVPPQTKPAVIHGVLPSKKSDGTVSYLPVKFTKLGAAPSPVVASLPAATTTQGTPILAGGGVTIVIPPAASAVASSTQNVQLMAAPQQAAFHIATTVATPSTSTSIAHL